MTDLHKRSQFTLLLDTDDLVKLRQEAKEKGISTNKYIGEVIKERSLKNEKDDNDKL